MCEQAYHPPGKGLTAVILEASMKKLCGGYGKPH